jgi:hypothetical protein
MIRAFWDDSKHPIEEKIRRAIFECQRCHGECPDLVWVRADDIGALSSVDGVAVEVSQSGIKLQPHMFELRIPEASAPIVASVDDVIQASLF